MWSIIYLTIIITYFFVLMKSFGENTDRDSYQTLSFANHDKNDTNNLKINGFSFFPQIIILPVGSTNKGNFVLEQKNKYGIDVWDEDLNIDTTKLKRYIEPNFSLQIIENE